MNHAELKRAAEAFESIQPVEARFCPSCGGRDLERNHWHDGDKVLRAGSRCDETCASWRAGNGMKFRECASCGCTFGVVCFEPKLSERPDRRG